MCGGCNIWAESAGASLIVARYWWVARQGRKAVSAAEGFTVDAAVEVPLDAESSTFVDPLPDLVRTLRS